MPKKKLTKAQVKRKLKTCTNAMYDMILDKMGHANSDVPMSLPKLMEMHKLLQNATKRMKCIPWEKWFDDERSFEQIVVRLLVVYALLQCGLSDILQEVI